MAGASMKSLLPGDTVVVTKLDRLARSSRDLHNIVHDLEASECGFVSLGESWCDTTTAAGKLMMTVMGGIAEFERGLIQARCEEGIARAREQGKKFGRPSALDAGQRRAGLVVETPRPSPDLVHGVPGYYRPADDDATRIAAA